MKSIIAVISLSIVCVTLSFLLGRYSVKCNECVTHTPIIKYIERTETIKNIEDEINKVSIPLDRIKRDSLRAIYNPR